MMSERIYEGPSGECRLYRRLEKRNGGAEITEEAMLNVAENGNLILTETCFKNGAYDSSENSWQISVGNLIALIKENSRKC